MTTYTSLIELIETACIKYECLIAFENMGTKLSFKKLDFLSKSFANYLHNNTNLVKGDRIAIQMPNTLQYPVALLGALRAGLIVVNINPLYTPEEMKVQLQDSGAKAIVILENFAFKLEEVFEKLNDHQLVIVTEVGDLLGKIKGFVINKFVKYTKKITPKYSLPNTVKFTKTLKEGAKFKYKSLKVSENDTAFLQYTGGTTGIAKGAILTHKNILSNINQFYEWTKSKVEEAMEIQVTPLPLYHIMPLTNTLSMLNLGAKNVLVTNPRDTKKFIKILKKHSFTLLTGVNTLFKSLMTKKEFFSIDFSKCKIVMGGGSSIQEAVAKKWELITNTCLIEAYGLTEASPGVIANPVNGKQQYNTVGLPLKYTKIKIINHNGKEVKQGECGELLVQGPQVMKGYWKNEIETKAALVDGWLKTGDIAKINDDGYVKIVDRKKEVIIVSGFNVYPSEVEKVINSHEGVLESAVIGKPDNKSGEIAKAYIVKKDPNISKEIIVKHCRKKLTNYKIPKYIEFCASLPKSPIGKILKKYLK